MQEFLDRHHVGIDDSIHFLSQKLSPKVNKAFLTPRNILKLLQEILTKRIPANRFLRIREPVLLAARSEHAITAEGTATSVPGTVRGT